MTKQELIRDMKQFVLEESRAKDRGGKVASSFITQAAIRRYWGRSKGKVTELVDGLEHEDSGRDYKYFIPDVAERIRERMTM